MDGTRFYYEGDKIELEYWKMYKELFESEIYLDSLTVNAKVLYCFLSNRISLSMKNKFVDDKNRVYIYFTREEAVNLLRITKKSVIKVFKELVDMDLIEEKRFERNKAKIIYVKKLEVKKSNPARCKKVISRGEQNDFFEVKKVQPTKTNITKTEINKTDLSIKEDEKELLNFIKNKCKLNEFKEQEKILLEEVIETLFYSSDFMVSGQVVGTTEIRDKLKKITKSNLTNVLEVLKKKRDINNIKGYLIRVLYNSLDTKVVRLYTENIERSYDDIDYNSLYANINF